MGRSSRIILVALIGIALTAASSAAALIALPYLWDRAVMGLLADHTAGGVLWLGYYDGSIVFLCCLFAGLVQAAILAIYRIARPYVFFATAAASAAAWAIQAYAVAYQGVSGYLFFGHGALFGQDRSITANEFIFYVTSGFVLVGVCQALAIRRSAALAVFWPVVWLIGGLAFTLAMSQWSPVDTTSQLNARLVGSGALLGFLGSVWVMVPLQIRVPYPRAVPAPAAFAVGALAVVALVLGGGYWVTNILYGPIDDPSYFCTGPDPSPAPDIAAALVLQECAAEKTYEMHVGQTVAIDLPGGYGVDTSSTWRDVGVSDSAVLTEVTSLPTTGNPRSSDVVVVYRANQAGQSTISGVLVDCSANSGCHRGHRWSVTIDVT